MARIKRGKITRRKHKNVLKRCKGFFGRAKTCYRIGARLLKRAFNYQFKDRKTKKSIKRREFIAIINAFCRQQNTKYSIFIHKLNQHKLKHILDRKAFALLIQHQPQQAESILKQIYN